MPTALFDLDGTLADPTLGFTRSLRHAFVTLNREPPEEAALSAYIGPPLRDALVALGGVPAGEVESVVLAYRERYSETGLFENEIYEGIPECLDVLRSNGWRLAVATSKPTVFAERILEHFGIRDAFDGVAGAELDGTRDDKESIIRLGLSMLGQAASPECVMIGDRSYDIVGAKAVGIASVGVTWGHGSRSELADAGADRVVDDPCDLPDILSAMVC